MKGIGQDVLNDNANGLDEGLVGTITCHKLVDVGIHLGEHEDTKAGDVAPRVAGSVGVPGKLCSNPGSAVVDQYAFEDRHMVRRNILVEVHSGMDQEVKEYVGDRGLIRHNVFDEGWVEGAVVPWVILEIGWIRLRDLSEKEEVTNLVNKVHVTGVSVSDIGSAVAECGWGHPAKDSEIDQGFRGR